MNSYIENANLQVIDTNEIKNLCEQAIYNYYYGVVVNPDYVSFAKKQLEHTNIQIITQIGNLIGSNKIAVKEYEAIVAIEDGADEIDLNINLAAVKNSDFKYLKEEITTVQAAIDGRCLKINLHLDYLTEEEVVKIVDVCNQTYINFISLNANMDKILQVLPIIKDNKLDVIDIKVNCNIKDDNELMDLIDNNVSRIGKIN